MKLLIGFSIIVLAAVGLSQAIGSNSPDRPPGIAANQWAPISDSLGVVLVPEADHAVSTQSPTVPLADPSGFGLYTDPSPAVQAIIEQGNPVRGYVMVKRGKYWRPLVVVAPSTPG